MADQFNIPQVNPPAPQFQPPTDLVNAYLNRPTAYQVGTQQIGQGLNSILENYYKQQQLKAGAFEAGGPYLMNLLYGKGPQTPSVMPGQTGSPQTPSSAPPASPGAPNQSLAPSVPPSSGQPSQPQPDTQPSQAIQASVAMGHPDFTGHLSRIQNLQNQMAGVQGMGKYGREQQQGIGQQIAAEKSSLDAEQAPLQYAKTQQELSNAQQQIPLDIGKTSGEVQQKYSVQDQKIQAGFKALQDLNDAWEKIPPNQKGPLVGGITKSAGSIASGKAPQLTSFNKVRDLSATTIATALLPESARTNPQAVAEFVKNFPTAQSSPEEKQAVMQHLYSELKNQHDLNTSAYQSAAQAFEGALKASKVPNMNFGNQTSQIHNTALAWAKAHPNDSRAPAILAKAQSALGGQ